MSPKQQSHQKLSTGTYLLIHRVLGNMQLLILHIKHSNNIAQKITAQDEKSIGVSAIVAGWQLPEDGGCANVSFADKREQILGLHWKLFPADADAEFWYRGVACRRVQVECSVKPCRRITSQGKISTVSCAVA